MARRGESLAHRLAAGERHVVLRGPPPGQHRDPHGKIPSNGSSLLPLPLPCPCPCPWPWPWSSGVGGTAVGRHLRLGVARAAVRARLDATHREADARAALDLGARRRVLADDGAVLRRVGHGLVAGGHAQPERAQLGGGVGQRRAADRRDGHARRPAGDEDRHRRAAADAGVAARVLCEHRAGVAVLVVALLHGDLEARVLERRGRLAPALADDGRDGDDGRPVGDDERHGRPALELAACWGIGGDRAILVDRVAGASLLLDLEARVAQSLPRLGAAQPLDRGHLVDALPVGHGDLDGGAGLGAVAGPRTLGDDAVARLARRSAADGADLEARLRAAAASRRSPRARRRRARRAAPRRRAAASRRWRRPQRRRARAAPRSSQRRRRFGGASAWRTGIAAGPVAGGRRVAGHDGPHVLQRGDERVRVGEAPLRILLERVQHDGVELGRDAARRRGPAAPAARRPA